MSPTGWRPAEDPPPPPVWLVAADDLATVRPPVGWTARDGFALPAEPWDLTARRWLCVGTVDDAAAIADAMEALARGAGLAIAVAVTGELGHRFLEDLHKVASPTPHEPPAGPQLDPTQIALLDALVAGATVTEAADRLHVSRRTANRHLTEIRTALGVETTAAAVNAWANRPPPR